MGCSTPSSLHRLSSSELGGNTRAEAHHTVQFFLPLPPDAEPTAVIRQLRWEAHYWKTLHQQTLSFLKEERKALKEKRKALKEERKARVRDTASHVCFNSIVAIAELVAKFLRPRLGSAYLQEQVEQLKDRLEQLAQLHLESGVETVRKRRRVTNGQVSQGMVVPSTILQGTLISYSFHLFGPAGRSWHR